MKKGVVSTDAFAQQLTVAVSPFDIRGEGGTKNDADGIYELFVTELVASNSVKVVDRNSFDKIMAEMKFQSSDWSDSQKVAKLGAALNANSIICSVLMKSEDQLSITSNILDINTAQILSSSVMQFKNIDEASTKLLGLVNDIVGSLSKLRATQKYKVGDRGPAGGIVFFDKGVYEADWRYLEISPNAIGPAKWGAYGYDVSGTETNVGSGKKNTQAIVNKLKELGESVRAAQICVALKINGYNDWFLPSKDELNLIYTNLKKKKIYALTNDWYWSSSQASNVGAWFQRFSDGDQDTANFKDSAFSVWAVRAF